MLPPQLTVSRPVFPVHLYHLAPVSVRRVHFDADYPCVIVRVYEDFTRHVGIRRSLEACRRRVYAVDLDDSDFAVFEGVDRAVPSLENNVGGVIVFPTPNSQFPT